MMHSWYRTKLGRSKFCNGHLNQRGSTLLVAMIMLILLTLMAISAINSTTSSIQVVGNAQFREEANAAAQQAIEKLISKDFTTNPSAYSTAASGTVDFGVASYNVTVAVPTCTSSVPVTNVELNRSVAADKPCFNGAGGGQVIFLSDGTVTSTGTSWCKKQKWDVVATVSDANNTGANTILHQGVFSRIPVERGCP